jgi:hypothetical protein
MAPATTIPTIEHVGPKRGQHLPVNEMNDFVGNGSWEADQSLDLDRLSVLEARLLKHEQAAVANRPKDRIVLVLTIAGLAFAAGALLVAPLVMIVLSVACAFVLFGMNRRKLALANSVAFIASIVVVFVFVPALDEMSRRTDEATNGFVATMVSTSNLDYGVQPGFVMPEGPVMFPTPAYPDDYLQDGGADLPEP